MRVRRWETTLAGTAAAVVFAMAWAGAFHVSSDNDVPPDIFGAAAVLADEAPPVPEPPAMVLGATVERRREAAVSSSPSPPTATPEPAPTTTAPASTTTVTAPPPEPPPEGPSEPTGIVESTVELVGRLVSGLLGLV